VSQQDSGPSSDRPDGDSEAVIVLGRASLANVDFRKAKFEKLQLSVANFVGCDFRGLRLGDRFQPFFSTRPRSVFRLCRFDGADLRQISPEGTRFERCTFEDAKLDGWTPARAEFVECRFAGKVVKVTFTGKPAGQGSTRIDPPRPRNEFRGNDFRDAQLIDTVFVLGIDLDQQRWPVSDDYVRIDKFVRRLEAAAARSSVGKPASCGAGRWRCCSRSRSAGRTSATSSLSAWAQARSHHESRTGSGTYSNAPRSRPVHFHHDDRRPRVRAPSPALAGAFARRRSQRAPKMTLGVL